MTDRTDASNRVGAQAVLHLEIVHSDPEAVFAFLQECLGAERVEQHISEHLSRIYSSPSVHARVGNIVFQIICPPEVLPTWSKELKERGPGVHNITFYVDDLQRVKQKMVDNGASEILDIKVSMNEIGVGGDEPTRLVVMDAREQTGLRFELTEPIEGWDPIGS